MISVVMATYNGGRFVNEQLASVLAQLASCDEVVITDDNSTDDTLVKVRAVGDARIRVVAGAGRLGYVKNFERGVRAARGELIFLCDQDDVWLPRKVELSVGALRLTSCVASDATVTDEQLNVAHSSYFAQQGFRKFSPLAILMRPPIIGATLACRRGFLKEFMPFPGGVPHDFWLSFNAALRRELTVIAQPLILYRRHASVASLSASGRRRALRFILAERVALLWSAARNHLSRS